MSDVLLVEFLALSPVTDFFLKSSWKNWGFQESFYTSQFEILPATNSGKDLKQYGMG